MGTDMHVGGICHLMKHDSLGDRNSGNAIYSLNR